jgi:2,3-bisphosphoglycerate-independent phosphoglycerate mutase
LRGKKSKSNYTKEQDMNILNELVQDIPVKMIMLVIDGLGGLPSPDTDRSELETAYIPNLNNLASLSEVGLIEPVGLGITPGSGPAHLALFGYDPIEHQVGRGVLSALGVDFPLEDGDVAARINFATVQEGKITDRRAGRISTEKCIQLCSLLDQIEIPGVKIFVRPEKEHRAVVIFRGERLSAELADTDPQRTGVEPLPAQALSPTAHATAILINNFISQAQTILKPHFPSNYVLLRGFASHPKIAKFPHLYKFKAAAIASYPMYRGLAKLVGMEVLEHTNNLAEEFKLLQDNYQAYDFFYIHVKGTDSAGEDGDFARKIKVLEEIDTYIPSLLNLKPEVLVITGDHSTPSLLKSHSWHPVPFMLYSPYARRIKLEGFNEKECLKGCLGIFPSVKVMPLMLAHSLKLIKFGA